MTAEFVEAFDNDSHRYIIPADKRPEWEAWLAIPRDDARSWIAPTFAQRIGGAPSVFAAYWPG